MKDIKTLKKISDKLDEKAQQLLEREKELIKKEEILEDKIKTLKRAYNEFKQLLFKLDKYYGR